MRELNPNRQDRYNQESVVKLLVVLFIITTILGLCIFACYSIVDYQSYAQKESLLVLIIEGLVLATLLIIHHWTNGVYLFEPYTMVYAITILLFFYVPIIQFSIGYTTRYGQDVSSLCLKSTSIVIISFIVFQLAYDYSSNHTESERLENGRMTNTSYEHERTAYSKYPLFLSTFLWLTSYALCFYSYLRQGFPATYILASGLVGSAEESITASSMAFLNYFKYTLISSWLIYYVYGNSKAVKLLGFVLTLGMLSFGGSRSSLLMIIISPFAFYYMKRHETPSFTLIVTSLVVLFLVFSVIQVTRNSIRTGVGFDISGRDAVAFLTPYLNEIDGYKLFYQVVDTIPNRMDYLYGSEMFGYTLIMLIPRALWPGKPDPAIHQIVYLSGGTEALLRGNSYPTIGEFYVEFGIPGCVVGMLIVGLICRRLTKLYRTDIVTNDSLALYSLVYSAFFQLTIRGYFPSNCMMLLFLLFPMALLRLRTEPVFVEITNNRERTV